MRVKLCVCDICGGCKEDDGHDWSCTGDPGERHKRTAMRSAEFIEAGYLEREVAVLLDALEGEDAASTPFGAIDLEPLRLAYNQAQWS